MSEATSRQTGRNASARGERFFRMERGGAGDFPFYRSSLADADVTQELKGRQWALVLTGVIAGFAALVLPLARYQNFAGGLVPAVLFVLVPLSTLALVAGRDWLAIFRRPTLGDVWVILAVTALNIAASLVVALVVSRLLDLNPNPVGDILARASATQMALFYFKTLPQLLGEEVVSILPFLAILWFCHDRLQLSRRWAVVLGWLGAAIFFSAIHLPTYQWNFVQCFLVIGTARVALLTGYVVTKNTWVSTAAHVLNDWIFFTVIATLQKAATLPLHA